MSIGLLAQITFLVHFVPTNLACDVYRGDTSAFSLASRAASLDNSFPQPFDLSVALAHVVGTGSARLGNKLLCADSILFELVDGGLGGFQLCFQGGVLRVGNIDFALGFDVAVLQAGEMVGLSQGVGAQGAESGGEGFAVLGITLREVCQLLVRHEEKGCRLRRTSRRRIRSLTTLMMRPMVSESS